MLGFDKKFQRIFKHPKIFLRFEFFIIIFTLIVGAYLLTISFSQFDKYRDLFFAMHYTQNWFSLQDNHLGGITYLSTYPPLMHQILALFSFFIPLDFAYLIVMLIFWFLLAFYSSKFFLAYIDAKKTYFWPIFLFNFFALGMLRATLSMGWLTTVAGLTFTFMSLYYFVLFIKNKNGSKALIILPFLLTALSHAYSFVFLLGMYSLIFILDYKLVLKKIKLHFFIAFFLLEIILFASLFNVLLFVLRGQVETYHSSRDPLAPDNISESFYAYFGVSLVSLLLVPFYKPLRKAWKLYLVSLLFLLIGLGRTTPLAKILFDGIEFWIVYNKFLLFASIFLTMFLGFFLVSSIYGRFKTYGKFLVSLFFVFYLTFNLYEIINYNPWVLTDASAIYDSRNFVLDFLNSQSSQYRYQTFGYPGPRGFFYLNTKMPTLDTDYISFKSIEFFRNSSFRHINEIDDENLVLKFFNITTEYSIKYVITFDDFHAKMTKDQDWKIVANKTFGHEVIVWQNSRDFKTLDSLNVIIWENPNELEPIEPIREQITTFNYLWGTVPLTTLAIFIILFVYYKFKKVMISEK